LPDMPVKFGLIAILAIFCAALVSAKPFCNGRMIHFCNQE